MLNIVVHSPCTVIIATVSPWEFILVVHSPWTMICVAGSPYTRSLHYVKQRTRHTTGGGPKPVRALVGCHDVDAYVRKAVAVHLHHHSA